MNAITKRKNELAALIRAFQEGPVPAGSNWYLPFHEQRGAPRGHDAVARLRPPIAASPNGSTCQIFSGFQGSGKTTELFRFQAEMEEGGRPVVFLRGAELVNLFSPIEPSDLLLAVAAGVAYSLETNKKLPNPVRKTLRDRIGEFVDSIKLSELSTGLGVDLGLGTGAKAGLNLLRLRLALTENPSFKTQVQQKYRATLDQFLAAFHKLMRAARDLLVPDKQGMSPILLVDDLEKIQGVGAESLRVQETVEQLFWKFHDTLRIEGWHTVWAAPPYLQLLNGAAVGRYDRCVILPMVRVWDNNPERTPNEEGISAMEKCLRKRGDIGSLFLNDESLRKMITVSSGHLRDLVRLIREAAMEAYAQTDPTRPLNEVDAQAVINDYAGACQRAIYDEDIPWLRRLAESRALSLPTASMLPRAAKLIDTAVVMAYRNGEEWFDVSAPVRAKILPREHG
ncbi:MAG: hypothetical protein R3B70_15710 [Polyangiaceae bacterium]